VKELRLAGATTGAQANELVRQRLLPEYNRRFTLKPADGSDAHRSMSGFDLAAILCPHHERAVANDYTVRWCNRWFQLGPPALPGLRGGKVILEERRDGSLRIRFGQEYVKYSELPERRAAATEAAGGGTASGTPVGLRPPSVPDAVPPPWRPAADHPWRNRKLNNR